MSAGEVVWTHTRTFPEDIAASEGYPRARGVAIHGDTIYWGTADMHLVALDARTGQVRWDVQTGDYKTGEGHARPPLIVDGKVFIGAAGGDLAARGKFQARDANTGVLVWEIYTVPRAGKPGYDTWTPNGQWEPLGGAAWNTVSYDPELELIYFSTGQPAPWTRPHAGPATPCIRTPYSRSKPIRASCGGTINCRRPMTGTALPTKACSSIYGSTA